MATTILSRRFTIDDLDHFPDDGRLRELVDGRIVEWDGPNFDHAFFVAVLTRILSQFVLEQRLGVVTSGDEMVRILGNASDARGADIAFFARGRVPADRRAPATVMVPDLVIEILSPSDRALDVQEKVRDWLRAGVKLLWYVNPATGATTTYQGNRIHHVDADDDLSGVEVLPGFTLRLRTVLAELADMAAEE